PVLEPIEEEAVAHCPKLGFEDDPRTSFGRPTRLHRCFAAGTPLPLSFDQQRELCLSEQFGTCPRLAMLGPQAQADMARLAVIHPARAMDADDRADEDDSKVVRLPLVGRAQAAPEPRGAAMPAPTRLRGTSAPQPTPLRSRMARATSAP